MASLDRQPNDQNRYVAKKFKSRSTFEQHEDETRIVYSTYNNDYANGDNDDDEVDAELDRAAQGHKDNFNHQQRVPSSWRPQTMSQSATLASRSSLQHAYEHPERGRELAESNGHLTSPQRVRLVESEIQPPQPQQQQQHHHYRRRPASAERFGSSSQRASRSSLGGQHQTIRMGRFVNYYPASRQRSPSSRQPSPYAFHVPSHNQRNHHHNNCTQQQGVYGNSRATSPSYAYANFSPSTATTITTTNTNTADGYSQAYQHQAPFLDRAKDETIHSRSSKEVSQPQLISQPRQASYGYVAPASQVSLPCPASKFNKSLRSRTISHLPSMVQVTVDDDYATERQLLAPATSESDLMKAHVTVWRSNAELDQDNPFKPGTTLSWEADLMVRLIKRGYPVDELPSLIEAAKQEAAARHQRARTTTNAAKSCDRLTMLSNNNELRTIHGQNDISMSTKNSGFLGSNLRQANKDRELTIRATQNQTISSSKSHSNLASATKTSGREIKLIYQDGQQDQLQSPNKSKIVWANSLRRAKSMPRFNQDQDADSLDKLITSIEMEISELLESGDNPTKVESGQAVKGGDMPDGQKQESAREMGALIKTVTPRQQGAKSKPGVDSQHLSGQQEIRKLKMTNKEQPIIQRSPKKTADQKASSKKTPKDNDKKQKKPKCCSIQ